MAATCPSSHAEELEEIIVALGILVQLLVLTDLSVVFHRQVIKGVLALHRHFVWYISNEGIEIEVGLLLRGLRLRWASLGHHAGERLLLILHLLLLVLLVILLLSLSRGRHRLLLIVDCGGRGRRWTLCVLLQVIGVLLWLLLHVGGGVLLLGMLVKVLVVRVLHVGCRLRLRLRLLLEGEELHWLLLLLLDGRVQ